MKSPNSTGYNKFVKEHTEEVTKSTKALSEEAGKVEGDKFDVGTYQKDMGEKWRELSADEKAEWNEKDAVPVIEGDDIHQ